MAKAPEKIYREASGRVWETMGALEALGIAIYNEQAAYDFYRNLEHTIENESGKNKFKFLAEDEQRHRRLLEEQYEKESDGQKFVYDSGRAKTVDVTVDSQASAVDAVDLALEAEKAAHEFYKQAAEKTNDEEGRRMFERLAEDEENHYETLRAEREALLGGPYWFSADEHRMMES
ncbi:MAG: ferritin family protein [Gemmatimonadota bacterium]|nr:MAG: ferritin family protein [Gemmatimonadota bacterium]